MTVRIVGAVAAVLSALVHLWLWIDGVKDQGVVGVLFVVNVVAGLVIAVLLVRWKHWLPLFLLLGFGAATLVAFWIAATVGLFGIHTGWSWYAWLAALSEIVCVLAGAAGLVQESHLARWRTAR